MAFKLLIFVSTLALIDAASLPMFYQYPWIIPASAFDLQLPVHPNIQYPYIQQRLNIQQPLNPQHPLNILQSLNIQQPLNPLNIQPFNIPQPLNIAQPLNIQPINIPKPIQPLQVNIPNISVPNPEFAKGPHSSGKTILVQNSPGHQTAISSETDGLVLRSALTSTSNFPGYQSALSLSKSEAVNGNYGTSVSATLKSGANTLSLAKSDSKDGKVEHRSFASSAATPEFNLNQSSVH